MARLALLALVILLVVPAIQLGADEEVNRRSMLELPDIGTGAHAKMTEIIALYERAASEPLRKVWEDVTVGDGTVPWNAVIHALKPAVSDLRGQALVEYRKFLKRKGRLDDWNHKFPAAWEQWLDHHDEFFTILTTQGWLMMDRKHTMNNMTAEMKALKLIDLRRIKRFAEACVKTNKDVEAARKALESYKKLDGLDQAKKTLERSYRTLERDFSSFGNWVEMGLEMDKRLDALFGGTMRSALVQKRFYEGFLSLDEQKSHLTRLDPFFDWEIANWKEAGEKHLKAYQATIDDYYSKTKPFLYLEFTNDLFHVPNDWEIIMHPLIKLKLEIEDILE